MHPSITLFGRTLPSYGLFAALGIIAAFIGLEIYARHKDLEFRLSAEMAFLWAVVGAILGAKLLYLLTVMPQFISDLQNASDGIGSVLKEYLSGGFVFYGGLIGGLVGVAAYSKATHRKLEPLLRCFVILVPLFHIFGRMGCFMEGCCYGVETDSWFSIVFTESPLAPNGVALVPTQLIEVIGAALILVVLVVLRHRGMDGYHLLATYFIAYGVLRFADEFFRGDAYRGFIGPLSTSQFIALLTILFAIILLLRQRKQASS